MHRYLPIAIQPENTPPPPAPAIQLKSQPTKLLHRPRLWPLLLLAACSEAGTPPPSVPTVTDSAGVRIVTNAPEDLVYAELAGTPQLSIGEVTGPDELLFGRIASVSRDSAGNIIVADRQAFEVRVFDPQGRHVASFGQEGEGPGDFDRLDASWPLEDGTLLAMDDRLGRISRFDMSGRVIETAEIELRDRLPANTHRPGGPGMILNYANPPPSFAFEEDIEAASMEDFANLFFSGEGNRRILFVRRRLDGTIADTLAEGRQGGVATIPGSGGSISIVPVPFSSESAMAISEHGIAFVPGHAYEVRVLDPDGALRMIARIGEHPPETTDALLEAFVRGTIPDADADDARLASELELHREVPLPDSLPGYNDVLIAPGGELWAQRFTMPGADSVRWDVFHPDGVYLGRVMVPSPFQLREVGRNDLLGVATDELEVERVQVFGRLARVTPPPPPPPPASPTRR